MKMKNKNKQTKKTIVDSKNKQKQKFERYQNKNQFRVFILIENNRFINTFNIDINSITKSTSTMTMSKIRFLHFDDVIVFLNVTIFIMRILKKNYDEKNIHIMKMYKIRASFEQHCVKKLQIKSIERKNNIFNIKHKIFFENNIDENRIFELTFFYNFDKIRFENFTFFYAKFIRYEKISKIKNLMLKNEKIEMRFLIVNNNNILQIVIDFNDIVKIVEFDYNV